MRFFSARAALLLFGVSLLRADTYLVLPFFNESGRPNLDWIGESIGEAILDGISSQGMLAVARDDREEAYHRLSLQPSGSPLTLASVVRLGQSVDAEEVIYGTFDLKAADDPKKSRGSLHIQAQILDLKQFRQGPRFSEVGALEDLAALQNQVAWQALKYISPSTAPAEQDFLRRHPPVRVDALENYIRGLLSHKDEDRLRFFSQAVRLQSDFSPAAFQLGRLEWQQRQYRAAADWLQKVAQSDPDYLQANFFLGLARFNSGDYAGAQGAFELVAANLPLNEVLNDLGAAQSRRNLPQAVDNFQKALDGDQSDPAYQFNVGYALWKRGMFDQAADRFRAVLERDPDDRDAPVLLERCQTRNGPRPGDTRTVNLERIKTNYEESAYRELKSILQKK